MEVVKQWVEPKNASEIRSFLGLAGYYRKFIQGFSSIAVPLTSLTKKNAKFLWSTECQKSFDTLNQALITAPVLVMPSGQGNFVLYTDSSKLGLGAILMQHNRVIGYASRQLKRLNLEVFSSERIPRLSTLIIQSSSTDRIRNGQSYDDQLQKLRLKDESKGIMIYTVVDGIIRYIGRMWVPSVDSIRCDILSEAHMSPYSILPGSTKMYKDLKLLYWWPGDHVFVMIALMKGVMRFGKKDKLSPRFIGPFKILNRVGTLVYRVALSPNLAGVHNVFHVSMLRKYMANPSYVLNFEPLQLTPNLSYEERPIQILGREEWKLRNKVISLIKVKWLHHSDEEATWESEAKMIARYPE
ncbi:uncharacterized protein [Primulina huaijiensis]|uniref:uncharacterized protein n=1 Tax=Primulina huaijiensis TaxID=1492673 RepID=UPI003CC729E1